MTAPAASIETQTKSPVGEDKANTAEGTAASDSETKATNKNPSTLDSTTSSSPTSTAMGLESQTSDQTATDAKINQSSGSKRAASEAVATSATAEAAAASNETNDEADSKKARTEVPCLATKLGFQVGDRIEVEWDIDRPDEVETRWWGATLLPYDGKSVVDGVAVRHVKYDPYPDGGYLEESIEPVIFLSTNCLCDPEHRTPMNFRREGGEEIIAMDEQELETTVNTILDKALANNKAAWSTMSAAQQAHIASKVDQKKKKLMQLMREYKGDISSEVMMDMLAKTMSG